MSAMRLSQSQVVLFGSLAVVAVGFMVATGQPNNAAQPPTSTTPTPAASDTPATTPANPTNRQADREAIEKAVESFSSAFQKGDAKAVAAHWTSEGEYISGGTNLSGRATLEKAYAEFFSKTPDNTLTVDVDSIRFLSRDTAVLEGHFKLLRAKKKELVVSRCCLLYTREDGKWLIAIAHDWPGDGLSIRDLQWLIGSWEAKHNGTVVTTQYEWAGNKSFIRCHFTITQDGKTKSGTRMIGKDPSTHTLKIWTFEDGGGIGEAEVTRDGKKWVSTAQGATADGQIMTATIIMNPIDADSFSWEAIGRTLGDEELPDLPPIKVTRVKAK